MRRDIDQLRAHITPLDTKFHEFFEAVDDDVSGVLRRELDVLKRGR